MKLGTRGRETFFISTLKQLFSLLQTMNLLQDYMILTTKWIIHLSSGFVILLKCMTPLWHTLFDTLRIPSHCVSRSPSLSRDFIPSISDRFIREACCQSKSDVSSVRCTQVRDVNEVHEERVDNQTSSPGPMNLTYVILLLVNGLVCSGDGLTDF